MSLDLKDLRAKVTVETDAALEALAVTAGKEKGEVVREILHFWALQQISMANLLDRRLRFEGGKGILGGDQGGQGR